MTVIFIAKVLSIRPHVTQRDLIRDDKRNDTRDVKPWGRCQKAELGHRQRNNAGGKSCQGFPIKEVSGITL